jgi:prepilin-type N-terminal cleavage/methylation domain-containing protein
MNKNLPINQKGFTLIELLVVIAIIGILAAIVLIGINPGARLNDASVAAAKSDVATLATVVEACIAKEIELSSQPGGFTSTTIYGPATNASSCSNKANLMSTSNPQRSYARPGSIATGAPPVIQIGGSGSVICIYNQTAANVIWYSTSTGSYTVENDATPTPPTGCPAIGTSYN